MAAIFTDNIFKCIFRIKNIYLQSNFIELLNNTGLGNDLVTNRPQANAHFSSTGHI